ncbi:MAG: hypothetical protein MJZ78_02795 [Bacteroidales bacterium]|nr:hypothetical protein [Bacteroidales bacterium]
MTNKIMKFTMTVAASAMTMLMAQCRKPDLPMLDGSYEGTSQYITFSTGDDSKIAIETAWKKLDLKWQNTDKLYVYGSQTDDFTDGKYCGELRITKGVGGTQAEFSGRLNNIPNNDGFIRFYYFASGFDATTHKTTVDLSSQDGTLTTLANKFVAVSENIPFKKGKQYYESPLKVPYALANFDLHLFSGDGAVTMKDNAKNCISVDEHGVLQYTAAGTNGDVTLSNVPTTQPSNYYVAIMPVDGGILFSGNGVISKTSSKKFEKDKYYTASNGSGGATGQPILVPEADYLPGVFSVSATKQVRFSKGNLQYLGKGTDETHNTAVWRFADHQWDIMGGSYGNGTLGGDKGNVNFGTYYATYNGNTSGVINQSTNKEAWDLFVYAENGFASTFTTADGWRRLEYFSAKNSEWRYLINRKCQDKDGNDKPRYGIGKVHGVTGMILLPEDMPNSTTKVEDLVSTWEFGEFVKDDSNLGTINAVEYTNDEWKKLESAGAVFLPCAGWRQGALAVDYVNTQGCYYLINTPDDGCCFFSFEEGWRTIKPELSVGATNHAPIRLVQDVPASTK